MTTIYCSNRLRDFLGDSSPSAARNSDPPGDWNAHLFYFGRRKHIIFVNSKSRYCVIAEDILKSDLKQMDAFFISRLSRQLIFDRVIKAEPTAAISQIILPLTLSPTNNNRSVLGTINEFVSMYKVYRATSHWQGQSIEAINKAINGGPVGVKGMPYSIPIENMKSLLGGHV